MSTINQNNALKEIGGFFVYRRNCYGFPRVVTLFIKQREASMILNSTVSPNDCVVRFESPV